MFGVNWYKIYCMWSWIVHTRSQTNSWRRSASSRIPRNSHSAVKVSKLKNTARSTNWRIITDNNFCQNQKSYETSNWWKKVATHLVLLDSNLFRSHSLFDLLLKLVHQHRQILPKPVKCCKLDNFDKENTLRFARLVI